MNAGNHKLIFSKKLGALIAVAEQNISPKSRFWGNNHPNCSPALV
jgi:hypothetical protein